MALEVRSFPPRVVLAFALAFLSSLPTPAKAQTEEPFRESVEAIEAKARLLQELDRQIDQRRVQLAREEESLAALKEALEAARTSLADERIRLEALRKRIEADVARREQLVDERLSQIAKVYGAMKPKEAASAIEGMEDDMAVAILERLSGRTVGKIFDLMQKERVRDLTRLLETGGPRKGE